MLLLYKDDRYTAFAMLLISPAFSLLSLPVVLYILYYCVLRTI